LILYVRRYLMSGLKVNAGALGGAREKAAAILDGHAEAMRLILADDLKAGERLAAQTSLTQALLTALELRAEGGGGEEVEGLRRQVKDLTRQLEVARIELARARGGAPDAR
jgi:hypothetical protein